MSRRRFLAAVGGVAVTGGLGAGVAPSGVSAAAGPAPLGAIRFGVTVAQRAWDDVVAMWQEAEGLGFDTAFTSDHLMAATSGPPETERYLESWSLLAALAAKTERIRLGVLVSANTFRHPAVVAKMAATIDHVSRGRVIVGLGAGWLGREHVAYGIPFYTPPERAKRLAESVEVIRLLFTQERTTYRGRYLALKDAPCEPKPLQKPHPPILVGGVGPKVVQPLAARHAQIWHLGLQPNDPAVLRPLLEHFDRLCRDAGRDPRDVERATYLLPQRPADALRREIRAVREVGVRHFVLLPPADRDALRRFAREVMPEFRGA